MSNWFIKDNMMLERQPSWSIDPEGRGDALARTSDAYIAYGDKKFLEGIKSCYEKDTKTGLITGYRYPGEFRSIAISRREFQQRISDFSKPFKCDGLR